MTLNTIILSLITILLTSISIWIFQPAILYDESNEEKQFFKSTFKSNDNDLIDITVILPSYNEEKRLPSTLELTYSFLETWCKENNLTYEIIVVDDGSKDLTSEVASNFKANRSINSIKSIKLNKNKGKGGAVKSGVAHSKGKYILMADADGATDINDLKELYKQIKDIEVLDKNNYKLGLAIGSRAHLEGKSIATRAFYRTILMYGFHLLVMLMCTTKVRDTQCGFKLFTRDTAYILFSNIHLQRWAFDIELIYLSEYFHIPFVEVQVNWQEIPGSKLIQTKFDVVKTSLVMARDIICVRLSYLFGIWKADHVN